MIAIGALIVLILMFLMVLFAGIISLACGILVGNLFHSKLDTGDEVNSAFDKDSQ